VLNFGNDSQKQVLFTSPFSITRGVWTVSVMACLRAFRCSAR
jgi:hypothetical protein